MSLFLNNINVRIFAPRPMPKSSLLRGTEAQWLRHSLPHVSVMMTASSVGIVFSIGRPLVVSGSRPPHTKRKSSTHDLYVGIPAAA
jgi:hypothetical protein